MPTPPASPHNRLGLNYHDVPPHKIPIENGLVDAHSHTREPEYTQTYVDAAAAYGITEFWTMAPLEHVPALNEKFPGQFHYIAIPNWHRQAGLPSDEFFADWARRIEEFYKVGARLIKFHAAPGTCKRWGITLDDPRIQQIAQHAYNLGYHFMTHVGDPRVWFYGKDRYADGSFGTFEGQFPMLDRFLEKYPDRLHLGAHMGGSLENLDALAKRFDRFPHYVVDSSATKWIVRAVAEQSANAVRDFVIHYQDRIIFGSDLVVGDKYDWDHYASRFWVHQKLWESDYRGESPIADPDAGTGFDARTGIFDQDRADGIPHLVGLNLPPEVLRKLYRDNALRLLPK